MTTQEAIDFVQNLIDGANNNITEYQKLIESYNLVIDQLKGVLDTPSADLLAVQKKLTDEQTKHANEVATLQEQVQELQSPDVKI